MDTRDSGAALASNASSFSEPLTSSEPAADVPANLQILRKVLKPFLDGEWTSARDGLLRFSTDPHTGEVRCSPVAHFPHEFGSFTLTYKTLHLCRTGGELWKFEPAESDAGIRAVWSDAAGRQDVWWDVRWIEAQWEASLLAVGGDFAAAVEGFGADIGNLSVRSAALCERARAPMDLIALPEPMDMLSADAQLFLAVAWLVASDFFGAREAFFRVQEVWPCCGGIALLREDVRQPSRAWTQFPPSTAPRAREGMAPILCPHAARRNLDVPVAPPMFQPKPGLSVGELWGEIARGATATPGHGAGEVALQFPSSSFPCRLPYILTVPVDLADGAHNTQCCPATSTEAGVSDADAGASDSEAGASDAEAATPRRLYPLVLYLHSAGLTNICKGDAEARQLETLAQEAPQTQIARGCGGPLDSFIGLAPCCPPNVGALLTDSPKRLKKRKVYWFKTADENAYNTWQFAQAERCVEVELLVVELLRAACDELPIDPREIYFLGSSCGGYAVLRLAELVPDVPAAVVSFAGYYPDMPGQDHSTEQLMRRLSGVNVWPLHCKLDCVCKLELPMVGRLYQLLLDECGVAVDWVDPAQARSSRGKSDYHSSYNRLLQDPAAFCLQLRRLALLKQSDPGPYLHRRLAELAEALSTGF